MNGEQRRIQIESIEATKDATADYTERLYKFKCKVKDEVNEEIMTYNRMLEWVDRDVHRDDFYNFTAIKAHRLHPDPKGLKGMGLENAPVGSYQLLIEWESGETTWENYQLIYADDPVTVAMFPTCQPAKVFQGKGTRGSSGTD